MREILHSQECRTTFEVGKQEVHLIRMVQGHQRQDQGAQEFGLPRTGGSDQHSVRPTAEFSTLLDVEGHDLAGLELVTERDLEAIRVFVGEHLPPRRCDVFDALGADQLIKLGRHLLLGAARAGLLVDDGAGDRPPGQLSRDARRLLGRHVVGARRHLPELLAGQPVVGRSVLGDPDPVVRAAVVAECEHRDSGPAVGRDPGLAAGEIHDDDVGPTWRRIR